MRATIACGQFDPKPGDIEANTARIRGQAAEAAAAHATLLVLPELCLTGYPNRTEAATWAVAAEGPEMARVGECAAAAGVGLCIGFIERVGRDGCANSMAFIDSSGTLRGIYRKVHLWPPEREWAIPGTGFIPIDAGGITLGMWICYDTRFPEAARSLARAGATLGLVGAAWFGPADEWELAVRARAMDNGMFVAGATVIGAFGSAPFRGTSTIVDPHGKVLACAREGRAEVICAEYDSATVEEFRGRLPLLDDVRPESYA